MMSPANRYAWSPAIFVCCLVLTACLLNCASIVSEKGPSGDRLRLAEEEMISSVKKKIDYQLHHKNVMENVKAARGKIVKWHGTITRVREDKIQISGRMVLIRPHDGSTVPAYIDRDDPRNYNLFENFLVALDHPLPREKRLGDMTTNVAIWDVVYVIGKLTGTETIVTESGVNLTLPVLQGYAITQESDRNFQQPVWVGMIEIE